MHDIFEEKAPLTNAQAKMIGIAHNIIKILKFATLVFVTVASVSSVANSDDFVATKKKAGVSYAFTDLTTISAEEGVAFFLTPEQDTRLVVSYSFNKDEKIIFEGDLNKQSTFELPGQGKDIILGKSGTHPFSFELSNGVKFTRSILVTGNDPIQPYNSRLKQLAPSAPKQMAARFKLKSKTSSYDWLGAITPEVTRASGSEIFRDLSPAVVLVVADDGIGTGSLLTSNVILTNWHVIGENDQVTIVLKPAGFQKVSLDEALIADVIKVDEEKDLAFLYLRRPLNDIRPIELQTEEFGIAEDVHAIGHPKGNFWTYTKGVISQFRPDYEWVTDMGVVHKADVIQTQTPINPGNSGGPLLSSSGKMIGVNSFVDVDGDGLNYAVAISAVMEFIESGVKYNAAPKAESSKSDEGVPFDVDDDGYDETLAFDANDNGIFEEFLVDGDKDGRFELILVDENENDVFELKMLLEEIDGKIIAILRFDRNEDGNVELIGYDFDLDGEVDKYEET